MYKKTNLAESSPPQLMYRQNYMEEELNLDLSPDDKQQQEANRTEQRLRNLSSEKAKLAADKEELAKAKDLAETEKQAAIKDAEFYKNFNTTASKYQGAAEYQDKIREKVLAGYDLEDATISILAKEGKFQSAAKQVERSSPVGGSAVTNLTSGEKAIGDMTQAERRQQLMEAERRGDIGLT